MNRVILHMGSAVLSVLLLLSAPALAEFRHPAKNHATVNIYETVSSITGVPSDLLWAIAHVESKNNAFYLNYKGKSYNFQSKVRAYQILKYVGNDIDIGLTQINCYWWCKRLNVNKYELLDPLTNLMASARILQTIIEEHYTSKKNPTPRDFWKAVGHYHNSGHTRSVNYAWQVHDALKKLNRARKNMESRERGDK
jgi:hypothetical protein